MDVISTPLCTVTRGTFLCSPPPLTMRIPNHCVALGCCRPLASRWLCCHPIFTLTVSVKIGRQCNMLGRHVSPTAAASQGWVTPPIIWGSKRATWALWMDMWWTRSEFDRFLYFGGMEWTRIWLSEENNLFRDGSNPLHFKIKHIQKKVRPTPIHPNPQAKPMLKYYSLDIEIFIIVDFFFKFDLRLAQKLI